MIDLQPLVDPAFWFRLQPNTLSPFFEQAFFTLFALLLLSGAIGRVVARRKEGDRFMIRLYRKISSMLSTMGLVGFIWFFFSFETAYFLGARFWFLVWLVGLGYWIFTIVKYAKITIPEERERIAARSEGNRYLPRRKRK